MNEEKFEEDFKEYVERSIEVAKAFKGMSEAIKKVAVALESTLNSNASIYIMGNGGSAATASHMASDLNKTAITEGRKRFKAYCLNDNIPIMLAWANDDSYDSVFIEQLKNFLSENDVVIGISGSGNSKNVIRAIEYANSRGNMTIGITGAINPDGGMLGKIAKLPIVIPDNNMYRLEDFHLFINHALVYALKHNGESNKQSKA